MVKWPYVIAEIIFFLFIGGFASLLGFAVGYVRKSPLVAVAIGILLGFLSFAVSVASNPFGAIFGFLLGVNPFNEFLISVVFSVAFAVVGFFLGMRVKSGRGR